LPGASGRHKPRDKYVHGSQHGVQIRHAPKSHRTARASHQLTVSATLTINFIRC
jgi:hypothetical protein